MDITVYLPDELGLLAKDEEINFSGTLRRAVIEELARIQALRKVSENGVGEIELDLISEEGIPYVGRFVGFELSDDGESRTAYISQAKEEDRARVIVYDSSDRTYFDYPEQDRPEIHDEVTEWPALSTFRKDQVIRITAALGLKAAVDI